MPKPGPAFDENDAMMLLALTMEHQTEQIGDWLAEHVATARDGFTLIYLLAYMIVHQAWPDMPEDSMLAIEQLAEPPATTDPDERWAALTAARIITTIANHDEESATALIETAINGGPDPSGRVLIHLLGIWASVARATIKKENTDA